MKKVFETFERSKQSTNPFEPAKRSNWLNQVRRCCCEEFFRQTQFPTTGTAQAVRSNNSGTAQAVRSNNSGTAQAVRSQSADLNSTSTALFTWPTLIASPTAILIAIFFNFLTGCTPAPEQTSAPTPSPTPFNTTSERPLTLTPQQSAPRVLSTVGMIGDLVRLVGGSHVQASTLMGAGVDPHLYKPTRDDVVKLRKASLMFYNGLHLEGKMGTVFQRLERVDSSNRHFAIAPAALSLASDATSSKQNLEFEGDPHVWMDVEVWSFAPSCIAKVLSELDPTHQSDFERRAKQVENDLVLLNQYGKEVLATIPEQSRVLITSHDAFQYFGRRYGIRVEGIQGISTDSEAGLQRVRSLVNQIVDQRIPAIFIESSVSGQMITALIKGAEAQGATVSIEGPLYSDALGPHGTYEGTYIGMMEHNFNTVTKSLGGQTPEGGFATWSLKKSNL